MVKIAVIFSCLLITLSCKNQENTKEREENHNITNLQLSTQTKKHITRAKTTDTLLIKDKQILFLGLSYSHLNNIDKELVNTIGCKITIVDQNCEVLNFNNTDTVEITSYNRDRTAIFYIDGKKPLFIHPQYIDYISTYYFDPEYKGFEYVYRDGQYIVNELGYAACNGDLELVQSIISCDSTKINNDAMYDYSFAYDAFFASMIGNKYNVAKYLINKGVDVNRPYTESYLTPLSLASLIDNKDKSIEFGKMLIRKGANVDGYGKSQFTSSFNNPIANAIYSKNIEFIKLLIDNSVKLTYKDEPESAILDLVIDNCNEDISVKIISLFLETDAFKDKNSLNEFAARCVESELSTLGELINNYIHNL